METTKTVEVFDNLTNEENSLLISFIGKAVLENISFPSFNSGYDKLTIQQIVIKQESEIRNYGKMIVKNYVPSGSEFDDEEDEKKWGTINANEFVSFLKLLRKYKKSEAVKAAKEKRIAFLKTKLNSMKTEDEIKKELQAELESLK